jgi:hypothetical protein
MGKLTKGHLWALIEASDCEMPMSYDWFRAVGYTTATVDFLERVGLLARYEYANGPHFSVTDAGRKALSEAE